MERFEKVKNDAKKVFFKKKNILNSSDFMFDILEGKLIPMSNSSDTSHGSFISFKEYSYVFDDCRILGLMDSLYDEIKYKHNHSKEFLDGAKKVFDDWFKEFYIKVIEYSKEHYIGDLTNIGTHIAVEYIGMVQ